MNSGKNFVYCWPVGANTVLETLVMVYDALEKFKGTKWESQFHRCFEPLMSKFRHVSWVRSSDDRLS